MRRFILGVILLLTISLSAAADQNTARTTRLVDSLEHVLAGCKTAADSVGPLYDIMDVVSYNNKVHAGERLLATALRAGNQSVILDVYRRVASYYRNSDPQKINEAYQQVLRLPHSDEQRQTALFLRLEEISVKMDNAIESERQEFLHEYFSTLNPASAPDKLKDIETQFVITRFLQTGVPSEGALEYMAQLGRMIDRLPNVILPLRSQHYVQSAFLFSISGEPGYSLHADSALLDVIDGLDEQNRLQGRKFRHYDTFRYQCYRRMLGNYPRLTLAQVDDIYNKVLHLAEINEDVNSDLRATARPEIYWNMAHGNYARALQLLKDHIDYRGNRLVRMNLLRMMLTAATEVGDREAMVKAGKEYSEALEHAMSQRAIERRRELQIHDELSAVRSAQLELHSQQQASELRYHSRLILLLSIATGVLAVALLIALLLYIRSRRLSRSLAGTNQQLLDERDNLQRTQRELILVRDHARKSDRHKTEFVNNMSHEIREPLKTIVECSHVIADNVPPEKRQYLDRYAQMLDLSVEMLRMIVNDVLEVASLDNRQIEIHRGSTSVHRICDDALQAMIKHIPAGVNLTFSSAGNEDLTILTDHKRVQQVLINLLHNGLKFTESGFVDLSYNVNPSDRTITFAVTDSGIGVPAGKEEIIFNRFEKLSSMAPGTGLGLNICRMLASLLGGSVRVDTSYPGPGARFLLTLPLN